MSADNVIYIQKRKNKWWVWEQSASCDISPKGMKPKIFTDREEADKYAWELEEYYEYVEYGIQTLKPLEDK